MRVALALVSPTVSLEVQEGGQERNLSPASGGQQTNTFFYFFIFLLPEHQGSFWLVLSTGGAAERAGVPPGARLLEVNGVSVENFTHNQLSRKVWLPASPFLLYPSGPGAGSRLLHQAPNALI